MMKKYYKYIFVFFFMFLIGNINVEARKTYPTESECRVSGCKLCVKSGSGEGKTNGRSCSSSNPCPSSGGTGGLYNTCYNGKCWMYTPEYYVCNDTKPEPNEEDVGPSAGDEEPDIGGSDGGVTQITPATTSCSSLFEGIDEELQKVFDAIRIVVPILIVVLSSLDFAKAIFGGGDDEVKKAQGKLIKRLIVAFVFFLLPTLMNFMLGIIDGIYSGNWECVVFK